MKSPRPPYFSPARATALAFALLATPALLLNHASAATLTWNGAAGGAGDWSAANWVSGTPAAGDLLEFGGTTTPITNNNITADTNFIGINLTNNGSAGQTSNFTLSGNRITLGGNITTTAATTGSLTDTISLDMILSAGRTIATNTTHNLTISGVISESGGARVLTKNGAGTLTLTGNNTFTGGVTIAASGGKVIAGHNNALGSGTVTLNGQPAVLELADGITIANAMTVSASGNAKTLQLQSGATSATYSGNIANSEEVGGNFDLNAGSGGTLTVSGIISSVTNSSGLEKLGTGTVILSGNNTYTNTTTITAGVLNIRHANALGTTVAGTTVASGAALELQGGITVGAEALALSGTGISSGGGLRNISGNNSYAGVVTLGANSTINSDADTLTLSGGITGSTRNLTISGTGDTTISGNITTGTGTLTKVGLGTLTLNGANTYTGTTTISAGTLTLSGGSAIADNGAVTLSNATSTALNVNTSETIGSLSGGGSLGGNIAIASGQTLTINQTSSLSYNGSISGAGGLTINGTTQLQLMGNNSFTGMTTVNSGTLRLQGPATNTTIVGDITINGGSLLFGVGMSNQVADTVSVTLTNGNLTMSTAGEIIASLTMSGGTLGRSQNALTLNSASSFTGGTVNFSHTGGRINTSGTTTLGNVTFDFSVVGNSTAGLYLGGDIAVNASTTANFTNSGGGLGRIDLNAANRTIDVGTGAAMNVGWTIAGTSVGITKNGSGSLVLTANSTYTGATTINAGTIQMGHANGLGSGGNINFGGGALQYGSGITTDISSRLKNSGSAILIDTNSNDVTFASAVDSTNTLGLTKNGSGTLTLSGNNTYTGTTTINAGTVEISTTGLLGGGSYAGNIVNTGAFIIGSNSNQTLSGAISGIGALTKNGTGTLTLAGNNNFSGGTTLNTGTLVIGHANAAGSGTITQADATSLLKIDTTGTITNAMSVYNVLSTQSATLSGAITVNNATWDIDTGDTLTISGAVSGNGGVTKNGGGTLILSGNNTYLAPTVINAGTLNAASVNALGSNNTVTVNGGSLLVSTDDAINGKNIELGGSGVGLQFSGTYNGSIGLLTLSANSTLDLGAGSVIARFSDIDFNGYNLSIYNWTGETLWGGTNRNNTDQVYIMAPVDPDDLNRISFYSGNYGTDSFLGSGFELGFSSGFADQIIPVPEPETYATGLLLLLGGAWWMWRNRKLEAGNRKA